MADEIKQVIGFDVSQALENLNKLDGSLAKLETRIGSLGNAMRNFNSVGSQLTASTKNLGSSLQSSFNQATQSTERLTTSMGLLSRVVYTQLIVSAFGKLRRELAGSVEDAVAFQNAISRIQTIANGELGGLSNLSSEVRQLSDAFALSTTDVAGGLNEVISSQVAKGAQSLEFLRSAAELATAGFVSTDTSVNVLAGSINAFGLQASDADSVASKLFKTVDLGNLTFENLAAKFNVTSAQSKLLGVTLDEQAAFFASATNAGVGYSETSTLLSGILTSLIKPTDAMEEAFKKLGFQSAATAIQTLGFAGTVKALIGTTDRSAEAIAKLFQNVRGLRGALQIEQGFDKFNDFLKQIEQTGDKLVKQKALDVLSTDAKQFQVEAQKLTNLLTVDFGQALLRTGVNIASLTGGVDNLKSVLETLGPVTAVATTGLTAYALAALKGAASTKALIASASGGFLLAAGAHASGGFLGESLLDAISAPEREFDKVQKDIIAKLEKFESSRLDALKKADDQRFDESLKAVQRLNKVYLQDVGNAESAAKLVVKNANRTTNDILQAREKLVSGLEQSIQDAKQLQTDSQNRITDLGQDTDNRRFDRSTRGLNDIQQAFALTQRASDLADKAATSLAKASAAGDKAGIGRALGLFDSARQAADEADAIGERLGNRVLENRAAQQLESITNKQIDAEKQLQALQSKRQVGLDSLHKKQLEALDTVREQTEIIRQNSDILDSDGKLLPDDEIAKRNQAIAGALEKIRSSGLSGADLQQADKLGVGQQFREFNVKLAQQAIQLNFDVAGGIQRIQAQLKKSFADFKINLGFDTGALEATLNKQFKTPNDIAKGIEEVKKKAADLRQTLSQGTVNDAEYKRLRVELEAIGAALDSTGRKALRAVGPVGATGEQLDAVKQLRQELDFLTRSGNITDEQINKLFQNVAKLGDSVIGTFGAENIGLGVDFNELSRAVGKLKELQQIQQAQAKQGLPSNNLQQLQSLENIIRHFEQSNPAKQLETAARGIGAGVAPANAIADALERAADNAERAALASSKIGGGSLQAKAQGGLIEFESLAAGGMAKGTDTIPAMLSPGEFVINERSTKRFLPRLLAMNAGIEPSVSNHSVTNDNSIGDIIINEASNAEQTAELVIRKIQRAQRRDPGLTLR